MYNILMIDDEPGIVSGLEETLNRENLNLTVYTASTIGEGMKVAKSVKLDILCSDIQMPVMNGFQFSEEVLQYWKECKVLFLTGYNEFDYIYRSIHEFNGQYVLKSDEEKLVEVIRKYMTEIEEEQRNRLEAEQLKILTDRYLRNQREQLWTEYLRNGHGEKIPEALVTVCQEEGVDCDKPVACGMGRLLCAEKKKEACEEDLAQYLLQIKEEYRYFYHIYSVFLPYNDSYLILAQPKVEEYPEFQHILNRMQNIMLELGGRKLSFIYSEKPVALEELGVQTELFATLLEVNWSENNPVFIRIEDFMKEKPSGSADRQKYEIRLERWLMEQKFGEIREAFDRLYLDVRKNQERSLADVQEYYKAVGVIASYIENYVKYSEIPEDLRKSYFHLRYMTSVGDIHRFVMSFLCYMEANSEKDISEDERIVQKIETYIFNHIMEDISLDTLAELVYFNPSYLSRFYKANTGKNLSQFIAEAKIIKAKELLKDSNEKIEEISEMLGFKSSGYFTVFLKKHTGMTPTEYRAQTITKK